MYVNALITNKVIELFKDNPELRDNRKKTIHIVLNQLKKDHKNISEETLVNLSFNIDRAFREVQQKHPQLRGTTWLKRQVMSGELPGSILKNDIYENQLKLF